MAVIASIRSEISLSDGSFVITVTEGGVVTSQTTLSTESNARFDQFYILNGEFLSKYEGLQYIKEATEVTQYVYEVAVSQV